ncbi:MAG: hypothetical protein D6815_01435, partial [Candidatus Dadabacteria bacterium]
MWTLLLPGFCGADAQAVSAGAFLERSLESHSGGIMSRRFRIGSAAVNLGGFLVAEVARPEGDSSELAVDNLNFLSWIEATPKLRLFSEIEINKLLLATDDGRSIASDPGIDVNRLFGEFDVNDQLRIRVGKFLTPIGRWNPVLADPFVWTTSEPGVAELAFDDTTTGAMVSGTLFLSSGALRYSVYG